jgi:hypothetical protein
MANVITGTTTLSSAGTSTQIGLDPTARTTTLLLTSSLLATSTGAGGAVYDAIVQMTLQTWLSSGPTQTWNNISTVHYSSANSADGAFLTITGPCAGLRLSSSTFGGTLAITLTLKALQSITAGP